MRVERVGDAVLYLGKPCFDAAWRKATEIIECSISDVGAFIAAHYLHKPPAIVTLCLKMMTHGRPVGMVVFAMPPRETEKRYGGKTWELARLYLLDEIPRNAETWLIAASVRLIKRACPEVQYLVSYADPSAGHVGTIYKAANWQPDGMTDDDRKSPRSDYFDARTGDKYGRLGNVPSGVVLERKPRQSKMRFVLKISDRIPVARERIENAQRQTKLFPEPPHKPEQMEL